MDGVKRGGDRQELHEKIRSYSMEAGLRVKRDGLDNDLLQRIAEDPEFPLEKADLEELLIPENTSAVVRSRWRISLQQISRLCWKRIKSF